MMVKLVKRATPSAWMVYASPLLALLLTVAAGALLFVCLGKSPLQGLAVFFWEPLKDMRAWSELGLKIAPLLLIAVGLSICLRANVFNIGAEGQLVAGAIGGGALALWCEAHAITGAAGVALSLLAGALAGAAWAGLTAALRDFFNANEILVSLMLVYIAQLLLAYLVHGALRDPAGYNFPQSKMLSDPMLLPLLVPGTRLHIGLLLALLAAFAGWVFLRHSFAGFRLQVGGIAPLAALYAGFSSRAALWGSLLFCGALAGVAGACEVLGPVGQLTPSISPGYGFAAIIVAYVGRLHPLGVIFSSFVMALFYLGGELAQSRLGLPNAITGVFQGMLLFALLSCDVFIHSRLQWTRGAGQVSKGRAA